MIKIQSIRIQGFGSIQTLFYRFDTPGVNLIKGENGSGKSTLISALTWGLYGKSLKGEVTPWVQPQDFKGTKVTIQLKNGLEPIMIIRCKDYKGEIEGSKGNSRIYLYASGKYLKQYRDKDHVQKAIDQIMGMTFTVFKNSIVFGQKITRLLKESGPKQKELFEEAFNQSYLSIARERAEKDKEQWERLLLDQSNKLEKEKIYLGNILDKIEEAEEYEKEKTNEIKELRYEIAKGKEDYKVLKIDNNRYLAAQGYLDKLKALEDVEFKKDFKLTQEMGQRTMLKNEQKKLMVKSSMVEKKCTLCLQPLNKTHNEIHNKNAELRKKELSKEVEVIDKVIHDLEIGLRKVKGEIEKIKPLTKDIKVVTKESVTSKKLYIKQLIKKLRDTKAKSKAQKIETLKAEVELANQNINLLEKGNKKLSREIENLEWLTNFALSNKGLKNYIFNSLLSDVNLELSRYRGLLGFNVLFKVDLESKAKSFEAIIMKRDIKVDYDDLSGGQQQLVDICLSFSIHEVFSKTNNFNILVLDEVFESLSEKNIELISEIIEIKARKRAVHLVTHKKSFTTNNVVKTTTFALQRGMTTVID